MSNFINPLLTDMYQITMCYGYFVAGRHETPAVFDMFFRKSPFEGEYTIFAGLNQVLAFIDSYKWEPDQIDFLKSKMQNVEEPFWEWLRNVNCKDVTIHAFAEGSVVFPREPLIRIEGPIGVCQLLETTLLCIVNYASLVATNAARMRVAAGEDKTLLEMGLRRAQGPDGSISASRYAHIGGFNSTSNVLAGKMFNIQVSGTHAHAFVQSFASLDDLTNKMLKIPETVDRSNPLLAGVRMEEKEVGGKRNWYIDIVQLVLKFRKELQYERTNQGELAAFIAYCQAFPTSFLALVDTYSTLESGVPNFLCCALAMKAIDYLPVGIRLDSGDLSALSKSARSMFKATQELYPWADTLGAMKVVASNDLSEEVLYQLLAEGHEIDTFGIGTHLVTCQAQPALGCVYKLVETNGNPRIKLSQEMVKVSVPGKKLLYRFYNASGKCLADVMMSEDEVLKNGPPKQGERFVLRHPMEASKRAVCTPARVEALLTCVWKGELKMSYPAIQHVRAHASSEIKSLRQEHIRPNDPVPYKVSLSQSLFTMMHDLWQAEAPIPELDAR